MENLDELGGETETGSERARNYFEQVLGPAIEALRAAIENGTDDEVRESFAVYQAALAEMRSDSDLMKLTSEEEGMILEAEDLTRQAHEMNLDSQGI